MKLKSLTPMIRTKDFDGTIAFYTGALGFECDSRSANNGWASLKKGDIRLMVTAPNDHLPFDDCQFTGSFYFHTDEVDRVWAELKDRARICYPLESFDYGMREFGMTTTTGTYFSSGNRINLADNRRLERTANQGGLQRLPAAHPDRLLPPS